MFTTQQRHWNHHASWIHYIEIPHLTTSGGGVDASGEHCTIWKHHRYHHHHRSYQLFIVMNNIVEIYTLVSYTT